MKKIKFRIITLLVIIMMFLMTACSMPEMQEQVENELSEMLVITPEEELNVEQQQQADTLDDLRKLEYTGDLSVVINNDQPFFQNADWQIYKPGEIVLSEWDSLGRCGPAMMWATQSAMPKGERGPTGSAKPSGWVQNKYEGVVDSQPPYLYNRSHLLMWALSGLTDDVKNLITGTRYFNADGMLPIEMTVTKIVENGNDVLYRVTPVFDGNNLLASGVLMEAISKDGTFHLCRYVFNVQPGIKIDYTTGENHLDGESVEPVESPEDLGDVTYVLNTHTLKFHDPSCSSVDEMKPQNKELFYGTREELLEKGYSPCGSCKP